MTQGARNSRAAIRTAHPGPYGSAPVAAPDRPDGVHCHYGPPVAISTQRWGLAAGGVRHRVEVTGSYQRTVRWFVDDELLASSTTSGDRVRLRPGDRIRGERKAVQPAGLGVLQVRFSAGGRSRRVTWHPAEGGRAPGGLPRSGLDLDPEPGSPAARKDERIRRHPRRHALLATAAGAVQVVVPLLLGLLAVRWVVDLPWPGVDVPALPLPDLPALPTLDLPPPPGWLRRVAAVLQYTWPVLLAAGLAAAELRRRRRQDALKAALRAEAGRPPSAPPAS